MPQVGVKVTVVPGQGALPSTLSPSRAADFRSCELKFYFAAVERWRTPPTEHTALGNVVHDVAEHLYRLPAEERSRPHASVLLDERWAHWADDPAHAHLLSADAGQVVRHKAESALDGLFSLEDPSQVVVQPDELEAWVEAPMYDVTIRGRIDRMTTAGVWRVSDYKTGRVPAARYVEKALAGLFTYAAALAASHPVRIIPDEVELLYLLGPRRIRRPVLRPYLIEHAKDLSRTWNDITRAQQETSWQAITGPLCKFCAFAPGCPIRTRDAPTPGTAASHAVLGQLGLSRSSQPLVETGSDPDRDAAEEALSLDEPDRPT